MSHEKAEPTGTNNPAKRKRVNKEGVRKKKTKNKQRLFQQLLALEENQAALR